MDESRIPIINTHSTPIANNSSTFITIPLAHATHPPETGWAQNLNEESLLRFLAKPQTIAEEALNERLSVIKNYDTRPFPVSGKLSSTFSGHFRRKR